MPSLSTISTLSIPDSGYKILEGDCIPTLATLPDNSIDMAVFSPPFPAVYSYSSKEEDIGNSEERPEMKLHLGFFYRQLVRVVKPGRVVMVHVMQIPVPKRIGLDGGELFDFRGFNIRLAKRSGFKFDYDWAVRKNPQAQAITTRSHSLQFAGLENDRAQSHGAHPDYLLKFRVPGDNAVKIDSPGQVSRNQWIDWAECTWDTNKYTIDLAGTKSMTLNTEEAKGPDDTRHICPLQLSIIDRLVRMFTNPGELVLSPFAGVGSEGFCSLRLGRRFLGIELNPLYVKAAHGNLQRALRMNAAAEQPSLLDLCGVAEATNGDGQATQQEGDDVDSGGWGDL